MHICPTNSLHPVLQDDYIVLEGLELLGEVVHHLRQMSMPFPPEKPLSRVCLEITDLLRSNSDACQQAAALRTLYSIFQNNGDVPLDDTLKRCAESVLNTISKAAAGSDGASFALQVTCLAWPCQLQNWTLATACSPPSNTLDRA